MKQTVKAFLMAVVIFTVLAVSVGAFAENYYEEITIEDIYGELNRNNLFANLVVRTDCGGDARNTIVKIYDSEGTELSLEQIESTLYKNVFVVPNKDMEYTIKVYVTDGEGNQISETVVENYNFEKCEILYGYIESTEYLGGIAQATRACVYDDMGKSTVYYFSNPTYINGVRKSADAIAATLSSPAYAAFTIDSYGEIKIVAYDSEYTQYSKVNYDEKTGDFAEVSRGDKTVFYAPEEAQRTYMHTLSENYLYNLAISDYAVVITSIQSKNYEDEIISCVLENNIIPGFSGEIIVSLNTSKEFPKAQVKLYDTKKNLVAENDTSQIGDYYDFVTSFEVANENQEYIVEVCLIDENNNPISDMQTFTHQYEEYETLVGYVTACGHNGKSAGAEIDDNEYYFTDGTIWIDGECINTDDIECDALAEKLKIGCYAEFAVNKDGELCIINFADYSDGERMIFSYPSSDGENITSIYVMPEEAEDKTAICALYNAGVLSEVMVKKVTSDRIHFLSKVECDNIKFMLWENLETLVPLRSDKDVNTLTWNKTPKEQVK